MASVLSTLPPDQPLRTQAPGHEPCAAGQRWHWDGVRLEVLQPTPGAVSAPPRHARPNALSCVLRIEDPRGASLLLTGDIEAAQEVAMTLDRPRALASGVMTVPHHGLCTSSTGALLDAVAPHTAFVQAARRSRFGHPAPDVLARYAERGIRIARSDTCGAWTWRGDGADTCERDRRRRCWHHAG